MPSKLSFQFIGNAAGVFTGVEGSTILCDPWLVDGVFEGSWCHYPPLKTKPKDVQGVDALYVSHLHPDHFDERHFNFRKDIPILVLDDGYNFLIKKLEQLGYHNLIRIKDGETRAFREFSISMFAPFARHAFFDAEVGNLIDSAMVIECQGVKALNANDNRPTVAACAALRERFGTLDLAMLNYNAAGPYPSCFDNLTVDEKLAESQRVLDRNIAYMAELLRALAPRAVLPFAGAYVLGGRLREKNAYLGTTTWDVCAEHLRRLDIGGAEIVLMHETDVLDCASMQLSRPYQPIDTAAMQRYIDQELATLRYPYELDPTPDSERLGRDIDTATAAMAARWQRFKLRSQFTISLTAAGRDFVLYRPETETGKTLRCSMDDRLLRRILDRQAHWNNAEIGAHIAFVRHPNVYEPDLHTGLQFFHL